VLHHLWVVRIGHPGLAWFGRLPGDLRFEGERTRFYLPITSMVVVSVILTVVLNLARRWMG
jgi:hypothetical protein